MDTDSHIYGLLGRIHVLMRRTINRITDVEYMRVNDDYTREIIRLAQAVRNEELDDLCNKLIIAMELFPQGAASSSQAREKKGLFSNLLHKQEDNDDDQDKYIRSLR